MLNHRFHLGDTLIEVAMAIGIFSLVAIAVVSVVNGGNSDIQTTLESTMARNEIDAQAEALRFIQSAYIAERTDNSEQNSTDVNSNYKKLWKQLTNRALTAKDPLYYSKIDQLASSASTCNELYQDNSLIRDNGFALNTRLLNSIKDGEFSNVLVLSDKLSSASLYPRLVYKDSGSLSNIEGIYIVAVRDEESIVIGAENNKGSAFYDFYIKTCWYGSGANVPSTISTIVRLYDPDVEVVDLQLIDYALVFYDDGILREPATKKVSERSQNHSFNLNPNDKLAPKSGKNFLGWTDISNVAIEDQCKNALMPETKSSGVDVTVQNPVKTIKAIWECKYTLNYDKNTNDNVSNMPSTNSQTVNASEYSIKISSATPARQSWKFYGWSTSKTAKPDSSNLLKGGDNSPAMGISWTQKPQNITLYAVWGHTYELRYNKNVACNPNNMPSGQTIITNQASNYSLPISSSTPSCKGYKFKGWSTNPNEKSTSPSLLHPGGTVTFNSSNPTQVITLYGIWIKDSRDTAFLLDVTGSMSSFIRKNSGTIRSIVQTVLDGGYQAAFYSYERSSWINCDFGVCNTSNISFLNNIRTSGGTENVYGALINVMANGHWVSGALNTIIVLTDEKGDDQGRIEEVINRAKQIDMVNIYVLFDGWTNAYDRVTSGTGGRVLHGTGELSQLIEELKKRN